MPHRTSKNLCVYNVFSLRPQSTIPCLHPNCPWFFFNLSGCTNHMRTTHPPDQPLPDPHSPSPAPPSPQSELNWLSTFSPVMPNLLPTIKHSDVNVATPPSSQGMPSPSIDGASSWALPGVDCVPLWTSPSIDNPPSSGIDYTPSSGVDTPSPDMNSVPLPLPLLTPPSLSDDSESTPSTEVLPWVDCVYHPYFNSGWFSIS